jgi:hypothetical protein
MIIYLAEKVLVFCQKWIFRGHLSFVIIFGIQGAALAHDTPARNPTMLNIETEELPAGRVRMTSTERTHPPGARTPFHTSGPKVVHLMAGSLNAYGLNGKRLFSCGPAPRVCFFNPKDELWFFKNDFSEPMRFMLVAIDSVSYLTVHELVGEVESVSGQRILINQGNVLNSGFLDPPRKISLSVSTLPQVSVGDLVVTRRYQESTQSAETLVKLGSKWQ